MTLPWHSLHYLRHLRPVEVRQTPLGPVHLYAVPDERLGEWADTEALPPETSACTFVTPEEWDGTASRVFTDLIRWPDGTHVVNKWDQARRRWVMLSREDAARPYAESSS